MKKYKIVIRSKSNPKDLGFWDNGVLYIDEESMLSFSCSVCPNPYKPTNSSITWEKAYGWIDSRSLAGQVITHPKFGKCILINKGEAVPSRTPNPNHKGLYILTEVFFHAGGTGKNKLWRGSGGCITAPVDTFNTVMNSLPLNSVVEIIIK